MAAVTADECMALTLTQEPTTAALLSRIGRIHEEQRQSRQLRLIGDGRADGAVLPSRETAAQRHPARELAGGLLDPQVLEHQDRIGGCPGDELFGSDTREVSRAALASTGEPFE